MLSLIKGFQHLFGPRTHSDVFGETAPAFDLARRGSDKKRLSFILVIKSGLHYLSLPTARSNDTAAPRRPQRQHRR